MTFFRIAAFVVLGAAEALLLVLPFVFRHEGWLLGHLQMGTVPDWGAAAGAVLAVVFAARAANAAIRTNRDQGEELRLLKEDQQRIADDKVREQATRIAVWWTWAPEHGESGPAGVYEVYVLNASPLPIYDAHVVADIDAVHYGGGTEEAEARWRDAFHGLRRVLGGETLLPSADAQLVRTARVLHEDLSSEETILLQDPLAITISLVFRDHRSNWWNVSSHGVLERRRPFPSAGPTPRSA